jgi:N-acetylglucosaminyldiphosphoundecaprenol N-acetyl-beta-D-mannosaminyltransferase
MISPQVSVFPLKKTLVFSVPVHLCKNYGNWLQARLEAGEGVHVVTLNSEMVMLAEKNAAVEAAIQQADLVIPDGAGVTIYLRLEGFKQPRCPGIELAAEIIHRIAQSPEPRAIAFYGGAPGVTDLAAEKWQQHYPQLEILTRNGFINETEEAEWCQTLQAKQPSLILVGLGVPRQEYWIQTHRHLCPQAIWIGVGGSFDVWSGNKQRAPKFFCRFNLEWLYRLYQEPWRWRRMLVLPQFFLRTLFTR